MKQRLLNLKMIDEERGFWKADCDECPLTEALKTLNQPPRSCVSGIITNMQGPVVVSKCEFYAGDHTTKSDPFSIGCNKD